MLPRLIDADCALAGQAIIAAANTQIGELEKHVTNSLGVLAEDGVYAFFLYQRAKSKNKGEYVLCGLSTFLPKFGYSAELCGDNGLAAAANVANDLRQILFLRALLEKALVYARWQLKGETA